jgi:rare lipoprotein A
MCPVIRYTIETDQISNVSGEESRVGRFRSSSAPSTKYLLINGENPPNAKAAGAFRRQLMATIRLASGLLIAFAIMLVPYILRTSNDHGGVGSPIYPGNGPLPRGGGRYVVGQPYEVAGRWYSPAEQPQYDEVGIGSWYGPGFHRHQTANGEWFDMDYLTAAHTTLPLPSYLRVTNLENGRVLVVRANDRGPFIADRIIDLSRRAAEILNIKDQGTARVRVQYIGSAPLNDKGPDLAAMNSALTRKTVTAEMPVTEEQKPVLADVSPTTYIGSNPPKTTYVVQVGRFDTLPDANRARSRLENIGPMEISTMATGSDIYFQLRMGPLNDPVQARRALQLSVDAGYPDAKLMAPATHSGP